ncbi:MAG TPA: chemotaxis protein CheW [Spirochaetia bacterium]|nr:chemotaxis protein CheW [Spirochaetia bacterium]HTZ50755.1 chemotaxis protein CheW [Spirochaetia bacterium]
MAEKVRADAAEVRQLIGFTVGDEEYGLELLKVREVIRTRQVTWLPNAPSSVKGIINLRGQVIPIIDLRERFDLPRAQDTAMTRVIVVEIEGKPVGMVVDSASQVVRVPVDQFEPPPPVLGEEARSFISAVGKIGDRLVTIMDVEKLLGRDEMQRIERTLVSRGREPALSRA